MHANFKMSRTNLFCGWNRTSQNTNPYSSRAAASRDKKSCRSAADIRRMLSDDRIDQNPWGLSHKILDDSVSYAQSLRASRTKAKSTALQLKKLRYSFKSISTQILRSKTSLSARQVAGKARREVVRLKRQRLSGEYDEAELKCAIAHAQAMERVAKKKMRHLLEEELAKVTGGPCAAELEEIRDQENREAEEAVENAEAAMGVNNSVSQDQRGAAEAAIEQAQAYQEMAREQTKAMEDMMQAQMQEMQRAMEEHAALLRQKSSDAMEDMMSRLTDEMSNTMKELLENSGLSELAESMTPAVRVEIDPADYKMMKLKHRLEELREIAEADAEYLKAVFDRLERSKASSASGIFGSNDNSASPEVSSVGGVVPAAGNCICIAEAAPVQSMDIVSAPDAAMPAAPVMSGSIDVSI